MKTLATLALALLATPVSASNYNFCHEVKDCLPPTHKGCIDRPVHYFVCDRGKNELDGPLAPGDRVYVCREYLPTGAVGFDKRYRNIYAIDAEVAVFVLNEAVCR